jgi:flagellar hook assembly protein FlgD
MIQASDFRPLTFALAPVAPNPFTRRAIIRYQLPQSSMTSLKVYNITGQLVRTLADGLQQPGYYSVAWDGASDGGAKLSAGVYFCKFSAEAVDGSQRFAKTRNLILIK